MILFLFCFVLVSPTVYAKPIGTFSLELSPKQWKSIRLKNVPKDLSLSINVESSGKLAVFLMRSEEYKRFPKLVRPLFHGQVEKSLSFSAKTPALDHYFIVLDNRASTEKRRVIVTVHAIQDLRFNDAEAKSPRGKKEEIKLEPRQELLQVFNEGMSERLRDLERKLHQIFIFKPMPIFVKHCNTPRAFINKDGIVICTEYIFKLQGILKDIEKTTNAILFTFFHEVGHGLLAQWKYPSYDSEEVADEFASVLMIMLGQKDRLLAQAEFFIATSTLSETIGKAFQDDRHPLSVQRARNLIRLLRNPGFIQKWQTVFVPHMQTSLLERLRQQPNTWANSALIDKELASRKLQE